MQEPIRITRREMLKCILAAPLSAVLAGVPSSPAHAQLDEFSPPEWEWLLLWEGRTLIDNTGKDIKGNPASLFPTARYTTNYSQLLWTGYKMGGANVEYRVLARAVDFSGAPIGRGWFLIAQGTITTPAQRWFRLMINDGHWDEYRIELRSTPLQIVHSRLMARWDYLPK